jgi:hypothetical protein
MKEKEYVKVSRVYDKKALPETVQRVLDELVGSVGKGVIRRLDVKSCGESGVFISAECVVGKKDGRIIISKAYNNADSPEVIQQILEDAVKGLKKGEYLKFVDTLDCSMSTNIFVLSVGK